ncbi:MAG: lysophospholipid acyltransferase family protein [Terriglobales bacterium]
MTRPAHPVLSMDATMVSVSVVSSPAVPSAMASLKLRFTLKQRILLSLITWSGAAAIRLIAPTMKIVVSFEDGGPAGLDDRPMVLSFWHNCVFPAIYVWRNLGIRVMSSDSFDGEYTGRIIRKFGFVKVRGSSSRGAVRALLEMRRELAKGETVAFTIDGPKGPKYVAKPGPVLLAKTTRSPMVAFHIAMDNPWVLKTWDSCMIPKPFSRAFMRVSRKIVVPPDAGDQQMEAFHSQLQAALDSVREFAEANVRSRR